MAKPNTAFQHKNLITTLKHSGGSITVGDVLLLLDLDSLPSFDGAMNSALYQEILQENVRASIPELNFNRSGVL